jgi:hypothetical protein
MLFLSLKLRPSARYIVHLPGGPLPRRVSARKGAAPLSSRIVAASSIPA